MLGTALTAILQARNNKLLEVIEMELKHRFEKYIEEIKQDDLVITCGELREGSGKIVIA